MYVCVEFMCDDGGGTTTGTLKEYTHTHNTHGGQWRVTFARIFATDQLAQLVMVLCPTALAQKEGYKKKNKL